MTSVVRLIGVYDADGTLRGELTYWFGARLGRRHCSLCDITHGSVRERPEWKLCRADLPVPFKTFHRNDQPAEIRRTTGGVVPAVVAETANGHVMLLGPEDINSCAGSADRLLQAIAASADRLGLSISD